MFFVGATGQLLTLILTVCLPFVFLFSAQPKTEILNDTLLISQHEIKQHVSTVENISFEIQIESTQNVLLCHSDFESPFLNKLPGNNFRIKWKPVHLDSSGNKAPPVSAVFAC
jgi:hypothetical protein